MYCRSDPDDPRIVTVPEGKRQGLSYLLCSAFNMAPAKCTGSCNGGGVAREWSAPHAGTVSIRGHVLKSNGKGGAGMTVAVNLVSGRNVTRIWPSQGGKQLIAGTDQVRYATDAVAAGDVLRFEVHAGGETSNESVSWTPSVGYLARKP